MITFTTVFGHTYTLDQTGPNRGRLTHVSHDGTEHTTEVSGDWFDPEGAEVLFIDPPRLGFPFHFLHPVSLGCSTTRITSLDDGVNP